MMKKISLILTYLLLFNSAYGDVKISQLPLGTASGVNANDSFPYVDSVGNTTKRLKLSDIINTPTFSKPAGFDALSPMSTSGDLIYGGASGTGTRLPKGSNSQVLTLSAGLPAWANSSPMTTLGDLIYGGASGVSTRLAGSSVAANRFLCQTGTGTISAVPAWCAIIAGDVPNISGAKITSGTVGTSVGGTGQDLSASTGALKVAAGTVSAGTISSTYGGTGQDFSGSTGALSVAAGTVSAGTLALSNGGTGQGTKSAAFDALSPMSASGDIIYGGASGTGTRLPKGSDGQVLTLASGIPAWSTASLLTVTTKTLPYTVLSTDDVVLTSTNSFTVTLAHAASVSGKLVRVKNVGSVGVITTIARAGSDTIDGDTSKVLVTPYDEFTLISDGVSAWNVFTRFYPKVWTTYTMTIGGTGGAPTKGTAAVDLAQYRREGDDTLEIWYQYRQTGAGSNGSGTYLFPLPTPWVIDTAKETVPGSINKYYHCGNGFASNAADGGSSASNNVSAVPYDAYNIMLFSDTNSNTAVSLSASNFNFSNAATIISFHCKVPILNWR